MDSKRFDSRNLSEQAKEVIKGWAKNAVSADLVKMVENEAEAIKAILVPNSASGSKSAEPKNGWASKDTVNTALSMIQNQLNGFQTVPQLLVLVFAMWMIKALFIEMETAATTVLDVLALWSKLDKDSKDGIKKAAFDLLSFQRAKGEFLKHCNDLKIHSLSGFLTLQDFVNTLRPILPNPSRGMFDEMVSLIVDKSNVRAEEIEYPASDQQDPDDWEISTWSTLCLVPQNQSSAVEIPEEPEDGEIPDEPAGNPPEIYNQLESELPDFYKLFKDRLLPKEE